MKSLIVRRIIILMTIVIVLSSIVTGILGVILSEDIIRDIRGESYIPDLSILAESSGQYLKGNMTQSAFESILGAATSQGINEYYLYRKDGSLVYQTKEAESDAIRNKLDLAFNEVYEGEAVFYNLKLFSLRPVELMGIPIKEKDKVVGVALVISKRLDIRLIRNEYIGSLFLAILLVLPLVVGISYIILRWIVFPIRNVVEVALSIVDGDYSVKADETLDGEFGFLGRTMNVLSANVYKGLSQLNIEKNRLYQVLDSLEEGMIAVDENLVITHCNAVIKQKFGIDDVTIVGKTIEALYPIEEALNQLRTAMSENQRLSQTFILGEMIFQVMLAPIEDDKGEQKGAVILFRDITQIEKLEKLRSDYVANVSHELRSPLTSIRGLIEPLRDQVVKDEANKQRYYDIIYNESLRLSRLVDDILELSRLQSHEFEIPKSRVNVSDILDMVYERYQVFNEAIELYYIKADRPLVSTNYDRIEQIMVILLDNAYKFTPKGGKITIETQEYVDYLEVRVSDTGIGIAKEELPFVFQRFYKVDKSRTMKGTGLGLSIAKEILMAMDENISVTSEEGEGTKFAFTLHYAQ